MLKISVSFCTISSWPIPASSFPAVTTVCTLFQRTSEMGWKWFLPLTSHSPGGQQGIPTLQHKKECWENTVEDLTFLVGHIAGICHVEAPVPHSRAQGGSAVCANSRYSVLGSREREIHALSCAALHHLSSWPLTPCQWDTHSPGSCTVKFLILLFLLHFAWGEMWSE